MTAKRPMTSSGSRALSGSVEDLAQHIEVRNIFFESFSAKLRRLTEPGGLHIQVTSSYALEAHRILFRYAVDANLHGPASASRNTTDGSAGDDREVLADFAVVVVCEFAVHEGTKVPSGDVVDKLGEVLGYRLAFPYVREALSSMVSKLGFPIATFGLLRPGYSIPQTLTSRQPTWPGREGA